MSYVHTRHLLITLPYTNNVLTSPPIVGGGIDSRPKEQYPNRGSYPFDNGPSHHVPFTPTEAPVGGSDNVLIMNTSNEDRTTSFFAQPGILAGNLLSFYFLRVVKLYGFLLRFL